MSFKLTRILRSPTFTKSCIRRLATVAPDAELPAVQTVQSQGSRLRPQSGVEVSPDHGLWGFFRKDKDGKVLNLEPAHKTKDFSGRSWEAAELRRKNFKDLHTLWYVCLRERNLLATQRAEFRRLSIPLDTYTNLMDKDKRVRKTMKHIKLVLNERRLAFQQAQDLWQESVPKPAQADTPVPAPTPTIESP